MQWWKISLHHYQYYHNIYLDNFETLYNCLFFPAHNEPLRGRLMGFYIKQRMPEKTQNTPRNMRTKSWHLSSYVFLFHYLFNLSLHNVTQFNSVIFTHQLPSHFCTYNNRNRRELWYFNSVLSYLIIFWTTREETTVIFQPSLPTKHISAFPNANMK